MSARSNPEDSVRPAKVASDPVDVELGEKAADPADLSTEDVFLNSVVTDVSIYNVVAFAITGNQDLIRFAVCAVMQLMIIPIMAYSEWASVASPSKPGLCKKTGDVWGKLTGFLIMALLAIIFYKNDREYSCKIRKGIPRGQDLRVNFAYITGLYMNIWANCMTALGGVVLAYCQTSPTMMVIRYLCVQVVPKIDELMCDKRDGVALKQAVEQRREELHNHDVHCEIQIDLQLTSALHVMEKAFQLFRLLVGLLMLCTPVWFASCW